MFSSSVKDVFMFILTSKLQISQLRDKICSSLTMLVPVLSHTSLCVLASLEELRCCQVMH